MRLIRARSDHPPRPARMRQRPQQHIADPTPRRPAPLEPVPLDLLARRVGDLDRVAAGDPVTRLAMRAQPRGAQLADEGRVAERVAQPAHLIEQRRRPHVWVIGEPGLQIRHKQRKRIRLGPPAGTGLPALEIRLDRAPVTVDMAADRDIRPAPLPECLNLHVFSLCEHEPRAPLLAGRLGHRQRERAPRPGGGPTCWFHPGHSGTDILSDRVPTQLRDPQQRDRHGAVLRTVVS